MSNETARPALCFCLDGDELEEERKIGRRKKKKLNKKRESSKTSVTRETAAAGEELHPFGLVGEDTNTFSLRGVK